MLLRFVLMCFAYSWIVWGVGYLLQGEEIPVLNQLLGTLAPLLGGFFQAKALGEEKIYWNRFTRFPIFMDFIGFILFPLAFFIFLQIPGIVQEKALGFLQAHLHPRGLSIVSPTIVGSIWAVWHLLLL